MHDRIRSELDEAIARVIHRSNFILGEEVEGFENEFARYLGIKHCITCANGTDALEMALEVLGISEGDEIILPALGWPSAAMAVSRCGAIAVFVDVQVQSGNIDPELIEKAITEKTKAIIAIHSFGNPCELESLLRICRQNKLYLIEDCAQAHGAEYNGRKVGTFGDAATFSFYPTKNLGCFGDGGAIVTNNDEFAEKLFQLRNYGREVERFLFDGRNSRLDEIQAAVLRVKLKYLDEWNKERWVNYLKFTEILGNDFLVIEGSCIYKLSVQFNSQNDKQIFEGLDKNFHPRVDLSKFPNSKLLSESYSSIPFFIGMRDEEIEFISGFLKSSFD